MVGGVLVAGGCSLETVCGVWQHPLEQLVLEMEVALLVELEVDQIQTEVREVLTPIWPLLLPAFVVS